MQTRSTATLVILALCALAPACSKQQPPGTVSSARPVDASQPVETQILQAAELGNFDALAALLKKDPGLATVIDDNQDSPLHLLFRHRHWNAEIVDLLIKNGNSPAERDAAGQSPLDIADENMAPIEILQLLRERSTAERPRTS